MPKGLERLGGCRIFVRLFNWPCGVKSNAELDLYTLVTLPDHPYQGTVTEKLLRWGIRLADSLGVETWQYTASPEDDVYKNEGFVAVSEICNKAKFWVDEKTLRSEQNGFKCWAMLRPRTNNRQVHEKLYLESNGFF